MTEAHLVGPNRTECHQSEAVASSRQISRAAIRLGLAGTILVSMAACNLDLRGDPITRPYNLETQGDAGSRTAQAPTISTPRQVESEAAVTVTPFEDQDFVVAKAGDTIRSIAAQFNVDPGRLADFNSVVVDEPLVAGQVILFPVDAKPGGGGGIAEIAESAIAEVESANRDSESQDTRLAANRAEPAAPQASVEQQIAESPEQVSSSQEEVPPPPSSIDPLPENPQVAALPESPNLGQYRTEASETRLAMPVNGQIIKPYSAQDGSPGIDIAAAAGTPVASAGDGEVALVSRNNDGTALLLIRHSEELFTVYSNIAEVSLSMGDLVKRGETLGVVAGEGESFLHFEVRVGTASADPIPYVT